MNNETTYATSEEEFEDLWRVLKQEYGDHKYPKRKEFVKAWSSKVNNFGHNMTSRGEAGHRYLKSFLEGNHHDLLELKDRVQASIEVFIANFKRDLAMKRDRLRSDLDMRRWKEYCDPDLSHQIVPKGLELLVQQLRLAKDPLIDGRCSGLFESANGIPCYHSIRTLHDFERKVTSIGTSTDRFTSHCDSLHPLHRLQSPQYSLMWCGHAVAHQTGPLGVSSLSLRLQLVQLQLASNADQAELVARTS